MALPRPLPDSLKHSTHLFGQINNSNFDLLGTGIGRPHEGVLNTKLSSTRGPVDFPMHLLSPIAIMGYPTFSRYQVGATDLFKVSQGYSYTRTLKFSDGGVMRTHHKVEESSTNLIGEFQVLEAHCNVPELVSIEPCVETLLPAGPGKVRSYFRVRWRTECESYFAQVDSEYNLNHDLELPGTHFRLVQFKTNHTPMELNQDEVLIVINDFRQVSV